MRANESVASPLPYADVARALLGAIYDSLHIIYSAKFSGKPTESVMRELAARAFSLREEKWARHQIQNNPHVLEGVARGRRKHSDERAYETGLLVPRISRLCLEACENASSSAYEADEESPKGIFVPSPLSILADVLTVPGRTESYAYGFALSRAILFSHFEIHPPSELLPEGWSELSITDVLDAVESFRIYAKHRDNIHDPKHNKPRSFLAHFLAMKGIFVLRFGTAGKEAVSVTKAQNDCLDYLATRQFLNRRRSTEPHFEFRLTPGLVDVPDTQEILNNLMGVPIPIAGASTVFFGGLQRSHQQSVVISISGPPGTGKTSLALALASSLAPFGTTCFYFTFEEDSETLRRRANGLVPEYFRRTTLGASDGDSDWLHPIPLNSREVDGVKTFTLEYVAVIKERLRAKQSGNAQKALPGVAPLLLVIDSLTPLVRTLADNNLDEFCCFVDELRALNCLVVLLSAEGIPHDSRLEYLVDAVITLKHERTGSADKKPLRLFQLAKTRLQMSRPGSHVLHLSGELGVRISPQLPSQLDSHKIHKTPLPDTSGFIDTLRVDSPVFAPKAGARSSERLVNLYPKSRILVHGRGSSGKAALALKILMARSMRILDSSIIECPSYRTPRILVVSFLYPKEYYDRTVRKVARLVMKDWGPEIHVIALTPGFIGPEDFVGRILQELERGHFEGWPYTGILLDGLHNTFLQFPSLQENDMVWPALYSLLGRYDLTIVTTFTTFTTGDHSRFSHNRDDEGLLLKGQLPFLHGLVQGADFLLRVEAHDLTNHDRRFPVIVESAASQRIMPRALIWNAEQCTFDGFESISSAHSQLRLSLT